MGTVTCRRCGRKNELDLDVTQIPKCPQCENIRFDREFFVPIEKQVIKNFKNVQTSKFGPILNNLYLFGSYAKKEPQCRDIDFLVTCSESKLKKYIRSEKRIFRSQFDYHFPEEYSIAELESILKESFWDFRTCQEYPDCLPCHLGPACRLPEEDYHSDFHTHCIKKCKKRKKEPIPDCCFGPCIFLDMEIRNQILREISDMLKKEVMEVYEISSDLKVKILDIIIKQKIKELEEEFEHKKERKKFQLYKINLINGSKTKVRNKVY